MIKLTSLLFIYSSILTFSQQGEWQIFSPQEIGIPEVKISRIIQDNNLNYWFGTFNDGLLKYDGTNWTVYNNSNSPLINQEIWGIDVDLENNIWIATNDTGLVKFDGNIWSFYDLTIFVPGIASNTAWDVDIDSNGNKWLGTNGGGLVKFDDNDWIIFNSHNSPMLQSMEEVNTIELDIENNLWIGTDMIGSAKFDGINNWNIFDQVPWIYSIGISSDTEVWLVGFAVFKYNGNNFTTNSQLSNIIQRQSPQSIAIDENNLKWFTTSKGPHLLVYNDVEIMEVHPQSSKLNSSKSFSIYIDHLGKKWVGYENGYIATYIEPTHANNEEIHYTFTLHQNYPNPFNPNTVISYQLPVTGQVSLKVYDVLGREVETLINEEKTAGTYEVQFKASSLSSGIYFYELRTENFSSVKKMILLK